MCQVHVKNDCMLHVINIDVCDTRRCILFLVFFFLVVLLFFWIKHCMTAIEQWLNQYCNKIFNKSLKLIYITHFLKTALTCVCHTCMYLQCTNIYIDQCFASNKVCCFIVCVEMCYIPWYKLAFIVCVDIIFLDISKH